MRIHVHSSPRIMVTILFPYCSINIFNSKGIEVVHVGLPLKGKLAGEATVRKQSTKCLQSMVLLSQDNLEGTAIRSTP